MPGTGGPFDPGGQQTCIKDKAEPPPEFLMVNLAQEIDALWTTTTAGHTRATPTFLLRHHKKLIVTAVVLVALYFFAWPSN